MSESITVADTARPFSTMCLTIARGSIDDPADKPGVAFLTAQMLLRGAEGLSRTAIADSLEGLGSVVDLSVGRDHTMLWADALTRKRPELLAYLDRILAAPDVPRRRSSTSSSARRSPIWKRYATTTPRSACASSCARSTATTPTAARSRATRPRSRRSPEAILQAFHRTWSREGSLLGLAGDVDPTISRALAERLTSTLGTAPHVPTRVPPISRPASDGRWKVVLIDKPERSQTQVFMGHVTLESPRPGSPGVGVHHPDWTPFQVGQTTFGGTFTSRFSHEIREKRGWSYGAYSQLSGDQRLGTFILRWYPASKDLLPSLQLTDELISDFVQTGPTDAELDAAQSYLQNGFVFAVDTAARRLSELVSARLMGHPDGWVDDTVERLRRVQHADAVRSVREHIRPSDMVVAIVGTAKELEPQLAAWPRVGSIQVIDWKTPI